MTLRHAASLLVGGFIELIFPYVPCVLLPLCFLMSSTVDSVHAQRRVDSVDSADSADSVDSVDSVDRGMP